MKNNTIHLVSFFGTSLAIAILLVIFGALGTAKAQTNLSNFPQQSLNGLFTPTAADRFFEEGRRNLEREAEILTHPERYYRDDFLQTNRIDIKIIDETGEKIPIDDYLEDSEQPELN
ncbi:MAG: hypothetical protein AB4372_16225 [Xenococcus sp. (in: cyanobacteria)]